MSTMRVAIFYPDQQSVGRNDGAGMFLTHCAKKNHPDIDWQHVAPWADLAPYGKFDLNLWVDHGEDALGIEGYECPKPNAYWVSDTHLGFDYRLRKAQEFDYVFCAQKRAAEEFKGKVPGKVLWLPHAAEPECYRPGVWDAQKWVEAQAKKRHDVSFVGHLQDEKNHLGFSRIDALERAFSTTDKTFFAKKFFEPASMVYNESKIVVNCTIKDDIPMRVFEVLASGAFLITNYLPTLGELFEDGKHLVMYRTLDELEEKVKHYLEHEEEREKIAQAGYREFLKKHTFRHRLDTMLETCGILNKLNTLEAV